ncbi:MAG: hypothetical protein ACOH12_11995 [Parvibaculaceae bacterium]
MGRTAQILIFSILLIFGLITIWAYQNFYTYSHRYRLTVEVSVDGVAKAGSSVIETQWLHRPTFGIFSRWGSTVLGQAAYIDMGKYGTMLVMLGPDPSSRDYATAEVMAMRALGSAQARSKNGYPISLETLKDFSRVTGRAELHEGHFPKLIWFSDITDLKTGKFVLPQDFETVIGPNVHFIGATVEITTDPISSGLNKKLPFLYDLYLRQRQNGKMGIVGGSRFDATAIFGDSD